MPPMWSRRSMSPIRAASRAVGAGRKRNGRRDMSLIRVAVSGSAATAPVPLATGRPVFPAHQGSLYSCGRSEEHTSELQSLMRISYAVFCLKKKKKKKHTQTIKNEKLYNKTNHKRRNSASRHSIHTQLR